MSYSEMIQIAITVLIPTTGLMLTVGDKIFNRIRAIESEIKKISTDQKIRETEERYQQSTIAAIELRIANLEKYIESKSEKIERCSDRNKRAIYEITAFLQARGFTDRSGVGWPTSDPPTIGYSTDSQDPLSCPAKRSPARGIIPE